MHGGMRELGLPLKVSGSLSSCSSGCEVAKLLFRLVENLRGLEASLHRET